MWESLEELGQVLRTEREKKYLSVEDVADGLKISARVLRAIEAGDATALPHAVYVRGFISAYGKFLELDVQELLSTPALYDDDEVQKTPLQEPMAAPKKSPKGLMTLVAALAVLVLLGGTGLWLYNNTTLFASFQEQTVHTAQPAPVAPKSPTPSEQPKAVAHDAKNVQQSEQTKAQAEAKPVQESAVKIAQQKPAVPVEPSGAAGSVGSAVGQEPAPQEPVAQELGRTTVQQAQKVASPKQAVQQGPHRIIMTALVNTWIHSKADGMGTRQFALKPGDTFALTFEKSLQLILGNAGGVRIHYNGQELPSLGQNGEEKTLNFPL